MNGIEVGHSTDELSFREGLSRLAFAISELSDNDVAEALKAACLCAYMRACKVTGETADDEKLLEMIRGFSPIARVIYGLMEALMDIGA